MRRTAWFFSALAALLLFVLLKAFVFDLVKINNRDMAATYDFGDVLFIKKAFNTYHTNDIIYFEYPVKDSGVTAKTFVFQRLVGLPGDSIELDNKILFINGVKIEDTSSIQNNYFIETNHKPLDSLFKLKYNLSEGGVISNDFDYSFSLTRAQSDMLRADTLIKKVELKSEKDNNFDETCFPCSPHYSWNLDYYGKIYIPKKNDTLRLDTSNISLYAALIKDYENNNLALKGDSIFINNQYARYYVARQNYFFVLGDNRDNANDSRSWGFLPASHIVGKSMCRIKKAKP